MPSSILVVEDEPAIAELIAVNLQHAGHYPIRAYNAEQALSLMSDVLPDLVLLDWMLPGKSGATFAKELRNNDRTRQIPIIMLTALGGLVMREGRDMSDAAASYGHRVRGNRCGNGHRAIPRDAGRSRS